MALIWNNFFWILAFFLVVYCLFIIVGSLTKDWCNRVDQKRFKRLRASCSKCGSSSIEEFRKPVKCGTVYSVQQGGQVPDMRYFPYVQCRDCGKEKKLEEDKTMSDVILVLSLITIVFTWLFLISLSRGIPQQLLGQLLEK